MIIKIALMSLWVIVPIIFFVRNFNSVGMINAFTDPKKHTKVEIKNNRIKKLIPYKPQHFTLPWDIKYPYYHDPIIYKRTCVLTTIMYIGSLVEILLYVTRCVLSFLGYEVGILVLIELFFMLVLAIFFSAWGEHLQKKDRKKRNEGWANCRP